MGPRKPAVNTSRYSAGSRSKTAAGRASAKTIGTGGVCERLRRGGSWWRPGVGHRSSAPVDGDWTTANKGFADAGTNLIEVSGRPTGRPRCGWYYTL